MSACIECGGDNKAMYCLKCLSKKGINANPTDWPGLCRRMAEYTEHKDKCQSGEVTKGWETKYMLKSCSCGLDALIAEVDAACKAEGE